MDGFLEIRLMNVSREEVPGILKEISNQIMHDIQLSGDYPVPWSFNGTNKEDHYG